MVEIRPHHQRAIERVAERFRDDPLYLAVIVVGSVVRGRAREDSDVDIIMIATDEEFARRQAISEYWFGSEELCDYPGGYVDGEVINLDFMRQVAARGNEASRAMYIGAFPACSRVSEVVELVARAAAYPEAERQHRIGSFYSQMCMWNWFVPEAEKRGDSYLLARASTELVYWAGRLLLAYNRILYPYHKWFMTELHGAKEMPEGFFALAEAATKQPGVASAKALFEAVRDFRDWGLTRQERLGRFIEDAEWTWLTGKLSVNDW